MATFGIGQPVRRSEDPRLLKGQGRYTDDVDMPGTARGYFLRSPIAHADILSIDIMAASQAPGVIGIVTGDDLAADGIGTLPNKYAVTMSDGTKMAEPPRPALAQGRVRFVGEAIALIVAETLDQAKDASELIEIDYGDLPAATGTGTAADAGTPQVWDEAPNNTAFDWEIGDKAGTDAAFASAANTVSLRVINNRLVASPMETRCCLASYDSGTDRFSCYVSSQGVHHIRDTLAEDIFKVSADKIRVLTTDVGGGFGMKIFLYPEYVVTLYAARKFGRPVRWFSERTEAFLADDHGRDNVTDVELAVDADNKITGMRVSTLANLGAYISTFAAFVVTECGNRMLSGLYDIPVGHIRVRGVFTNTQPVDAYRGAGRPEAAYVIERIVDKAARQLGLSPADFRRQNFAPASAMPYHTVFDLDYDSGDFAAHLDKALSIANADDFEDRRADSARGGKLRGMGLSTYIEACAGGPPETAELTVANTGKVTVIIGTQSNGQGHETAYKQLVAEALGTDFDNIEIVQGDSDRVATGGGTGGSRSVPVGGAAISDATTNILEKALIKAADEMEVASADLEVENGRFTIAGTDRSMSFTELAQKSTDKIAFEESGSFAPPTNTYPNGTHLAEIEVDPDTGVVEILRYTVVDDFGRILNPLLVEGQVHGGIAQGVGQALYEIAEFEPDTAQLLTGSFMDYTMPRADNLPFVEFHTNNVPCTTNPLGIKGAGEAGCIGATPAIINAVIDALSVYGVDQIDMPATPLVIWQTIQAHRSAQAAE